MSKLCHYATVIADEQWPLLCGLLRYGTQIHDTFSRLPLAYSTPSQRPSILHGLVNLGELAAAGRLRRGGIQSRFRRRAWRRGDIRCAGPAWSSRSR